MYYNIVFGICMIARLGLGKDLSYIIKKWKFSLVILMATLGWGLLEIGNMIPLSHHLFSRRYYMSYLLGIVWWVFSEKMKGRNFLPNKMYKLVVSLPISQFVQYMGRESLMMYCIHWCLLYAVCDYEFMTQLRWNTILDNVTFRMMLIGWFWIFDCGILISIYHQMRILQNGNRLGNQYEDNSNISSDNSSV